jgi:hypothetical protein
MSQATTTNGNYYLPPAYSFSVYRETEDRTRGEFATGSLAHVEHNIEQLKTWPPNWNGYDVPRPRREAVEQALTFTKQLYSDLFVNGKFGLWREPLVSADEEGSVVLQWRKGARGISVFVNGHNISFIEYWGSDIKSEMRDGEICKVADAECLLSTLSLT